MKLNSSSSNDIIVKLLNTTKEQVENEIYCNTHIEGSDFFIQERFNGGQQCLTISASTLNVGTESSIIFNNQFKPSFFSEYGISISQRVKGITPYICVLDTDVYTETFQEFNIVSLSQATTTLTVTLANTFDGGLGYIVDIWGLADTRFNYSNLQVTSISTDKKTLTFTIQDDALLISLNATPVSFIGGKLKCQSLDAFNFARIKFGGISNVRATMQSRFNQGLLKTSGVLNNLQYVTTGITNPLYLGSTGMVELKPQTRFKIGLNEDCLRFMDSATDLTTGDINRYSSTEVKPSFFKQYRNKIKLVCPRSISKPIAKIVSAVKTGTTTATITTNIPHGLTAGISQINLFGIRDTVNFPTTTGTPISIINQTQFTIIVGSATTSNSYGGLVQLIQGQTQVSGLNPIVIQSVARDIDGFITLLGSASWAGLSIGEYIDLYGCLGSVGNDLLIDGVYKVNNVSTNVLILEPVKNLDGAYTLNGIGNQVTPNGGIITTTNCGGAVILRTSMRIHDITSVSYSKQMMQFEGQGIKGDESVSIPIMFASTQNVNVSNVPGVTINNTPNTATGIGGVLINGANITIPDITSAVITSTLISASIQNHMTNGFQITIPVTAVAGTNPTLDVRVEESMDGVNWIILYDFQRITAIGSYNSPMLRATGTHIRYVRTITGTTPSFTMAISRNLKPLIPAEPQKRLIDRSIVLTTVDSTTPILFQGAANNIQLVVSLGVATTAPTIQLEGSEDGINWYVMGSSLLGVANKTVQLTVNNLSATYSRARVSTVGSAVTIGYVAIKAWS